MLSRLLCVVGGFRLLRLGHRVHGGRPTRPAQVAAVVAAVMTAGLTGCVDPTAEEPAAPIPTVGTLAFDLPPGVVEVTVDGEPRGATPVPAIELSASEHRVVLKTACGEAEQRVVVQGGAETTIDRASLSSLKFAAVEIEARTIRDKPLGVKLHLGDGKVAEAGEVVGTGVRFEIPACPVRLRVEPTGTLAYNLGSFIEDIDPKAGEVVKRSLVLRPGPDVVRLHGGPFRQGPHPDDDVEEPRTPLEPKDVVVKTFDMDKTEVTARQYMECLGEGMCEKQPGQVLHVEDCVFQLRGLTGNDATRFGRRMVEGKEDLPANCVNIIEANSYCEWRGMRLPTPLEFDYAYRSGRSDYRFPWGKDDSECRAFGSWELVCLDQLKRPEMTYDGVLWGHDNAVAACTFADGRGTTEQGVCDLAGNRVEFAVFDVDMDDETRHYVLGGDLAETVRQVTYGHLSGDPGIGFRCVSDADAKGESRR